MKQLAGKKVLVTGGTQGVGAAIAIAAAAEGAHVLLLGLERDEFTERTLADCRQHCDQHGTTVELLLCDMARSPELYLDQLLNEIERVMPGIDLLVNNAGTFIDLPFLEMDLARYMATMHLNVTAGYFLTQAFARRWIEQGVVGRVVFTGSINGLLAEPGHTAYDTSKGAVASMVRSLCVALAPHGIRVNSMAPGLVRTPLTERAMESASSKEWMELHTPSGIVPDASVCAGTAIFLLSDAAEHIHGQTIYVDGGMSVWQQPDPPMA